MLSCAVLAFTACGGGGSSGTTSSRFSSSSSVSSSASSQSSAPVVVMQELDITVDPQTRYQTIDGFGAALPMWTGSADGLLMDSEVRTLVGLGDEELGLSIIRTIIDPETDRWSFAVNNLAEAKRYGEDVSILATPWSPPAYMKDNNNLVGGGKLKLDYYDDYADHLNDYIAYMEGQGVDIDVVSVQNEPDWHPDYQSCDWSGEELANFVRDYGGMLNADVLVGESLRFNRAYTDPSLNDEDAAANLTYVGGHLYSAENSGTFTPYPLAEEKGKHRWMTEWLIHEADGTGAKIWGPDDNNLAVWNETLDVVMGSVHKSMEINWNAYIWWWARRFYSLIGDGDDAYGTERGDILKRGWAFSHYSYYVRPGYTRVAVTADNNGLSLSAFEGDGKIVVVLLNLSETTFGAVNVDVGAEPTSTLAVVTSRTLNRAALESEPTSTGAVIPAIPSRSIVTVVMEAAP